MNGKANLRRGELCSPENKGLSLVLDGRTQFAPTMSNENRSFLRSRNTPTNYNFYAKKYQTDLPNINLYNRESVRDKCRCGQCYVASRQNKKGMARIYETTKKYDTPFGGDRCVDHPVVLVGYADVGDGRYE